MTTTVRGRSERAASDQHPVIVVAIDGGPGTPAVLRAAGRLALRSGAKAHVALLAITGVSASHPARTQPADQPGSPEPYDSGGGSVLVNAAALLGTAVDWSYRAISALSGDPVAQLVQLAQRTHASAIVIGEDLSLWSGRLRGLTEGALAGRLSERSPTSVVVVRTPRRDS
jgi:nucleotide-binding universal stress UspA family protein